MLHKIRKYVIMEFTVTATELARSLGDLLSRVRYRRETLIVERNGTPIAKVVPVDSGAPATLADALAAWCASATQDTSMADDLERIGRSDRPPANPWAS